MAVAGRGLVSPHCGSGVQLRTRCRCHDVDSARCRAPPRWPRRHTRRLGRTRRHSVATAAAASGGRPTAADASDADVERAVLAWLDDFVIGLELCPFASAARRGTRVTCARGGTWDSLAAQLEAEVQALDTVSQDVPATTLIALLHPAFGRGRFDSYMDVHTRAEDLARRVSANIQVVPFHPEAHFYSEDSEDQQDQESPREPTSRDVADAAEFATRSPVPILHLLRTSDVDRAEAGWAGHDVVSANADRLRGLGAAAVSGMLARFTRMAGLQQHTGEGES